MATKHHRLITEDLARIYSSLSDKLTSLAGSKILVTGGAGFMGSWLCELVSYLNRAENFETKLYVLDRDQDAFDQRLSHLKNDGIEFIRCDVRSLLEIPRDVNYIIHAAGTPDSRFHASSPFETMTAIAEGTANVLRAANRASNLIKLVNISSSSVYASKSNTESIAESSPGLDAWTTPRSAYAEAKRYAETLCAAARSEARIPVVTIRPFTFCGAYQDLESPWVLNNFISDALSGRPIRILGDGKSTRSLMYGADLAYWILVIMSQGKSGQVFNVGSDQGEFVADIAKRVADNFSPSPRIVMNTSLTSLNESSRLVPDVSVANSTFGLKTYTNIDLAISRTIDWYRASLTHSEE